MLRAKDRGGERNEVISYGKKGFNSKMVAWLTYHHIVTGEKKRTPRTKIFEFAKNPQAPLPTQVFVSFLLVIINTQSNMEADRTTRAETVRARKRDLVQQLQPVQKTRSRLRVLQIK